MQTWTIPSLSLEPRQAQVLSSTEEVRAIALNLPAGESLQEHQVHERAFLFVAHGQVEVGRDGELTAGGPGLLAHFEPNERHEVHARTDARLVLILAPWPGAGHPSRPAA